METAKIYCELKLLNGSICEIMIPNGGNYSRAMRKAQMQTEFDVLPFLMAELCRIDSKQREFNCYTEMMCDDYMQIMTKLGELIQVIK